MFIAELKDTWKSGLFNDSRKSIETDFAQIITNPDLAGCSIRLCIQYTRDGEKPLLDGGLTPRTLCFVHPKASFHFDGCFVIWHA